jgi:hypothetical protein
MTVVAFLQAQNCFNLPGSWRHPSTMLDSPEYYERIAHLKNEVVLDWMAERLRARPELPERRRETVQHRLNQAMDEPRRLTNAGRRQCPR